MKNIAVIVAGGKGKRMGKPKQFLKIAGKPMLQWTIAPFQRSGMIDGIILVVAKEQLAPAKKLKYTKIIEVVAGGKERQDSVRNGIAALPDLAEIVVIHDGARPAVAVRLIEDSIKAAKKYGAAVVGVPVKDTIKQITNAECRMPNECKIIKTVSRKNLWAAQTPQSFKASILRKAYAKLHGQITDDAMAVEKIGIPVKMILGAYENSKVTTPGDLKAMEAILKERGK